MDNFKSLGLPEPLMHCLDAMNFTAPTPIQAQAIPPALEGKDVLGSAQTGTGKTAAFGIPLIVKLMLNQGATGLVMTPTRELASQVMKTLESLIGKSAKIKTALLIGGESMPKQFSQLRNKPRLIVGTPGRIHDHLRRGSLSLKQNEILVLDETDRMLDMGFSIQIDEILQHMPNKRQTLLFSATFPKNIMKIAGKYMDSPVRISVDTANQAAPKIKQEVINVAEGGKYEHLVDQINERDGSILIFVKTKRNADKLSVRLKADGHTADAIHGDLRQNRRDKVIKNYRDGKFRVLVGTDVAARGLDIPHIEHVINFDLPQCPEDYIHRIGRTARAGAEGNALCFITPSDRGKWRAIQNLLDPNSSNDNQEYGNQRRGGGDRNRSGRGRGQNPRAKSGGPFRGNDSGNRKRKSFGDRAENRENSQRKSRDEYVEYSESKPQRRKPAFNDRNEGGARKPRGERAEYNSDSRPQRNGKPNRGGKFEGKKSEGRKSEGNFVEGKFNSKPKKKTFAGKSEGRPEGKKFSKPKFKSSPAKPDGRAARKKRKAA